MAAIIMGKNLLSEEDLIEFAFSDANVSQFNLVQLKHKANDASIQSSLLLIRMMKADRIYITSSIKMNQSGNPF
jgi:hypothetical protein